MKIKKLLLCISFVLIMFLSTTNVYASGGVTIKSIDHYDTPLRIQGIKAAIAWNYVKGDDLPGFNLNDRNSLDIIKINIDHNILEMVKGIYPYQFSKFLDILESIDNIDVNI